MNEKIIKSGEEKKLETKGRDRKRRMELQDN